MKLSICRMDYAAKCQLISLVEEEECIWNTSIEDYARLDKKNASWNRIHAEMAQNGYTGGCGAGTKNTMEKPKRSMAEKFYDQA
ncbi:hypothetical protein ANCCAN_08089 [Ancylostoma caninum]|uniref:MADF domain-containing protein n=1 Tax=Ancylostoma caninum TaxID=29170 RepID=A0A368GNM3_ANCCA|nr:hypothetical protein ANCCAN_08089 [Ancylostoma caninum]